MKAYKFDSEGVFTEEVQAQLDPLTSQIEEKEVYLLPAHATFEAPPAFTENQIARFVDGGWVVEQKPEPPPAETPTPTPPNPELEKRRERIIAAVGRLDALDVSTLTTVAKCKDAIADIITVLKG